MRCCRWTLSTAALAVLLTNMDPIQGGEAVDVVESGAEAGGLMGGVMAAVGRACTAGAADAILLAYALGFVLAELSDALSTASWRSYIRDVFNVLDLVLILGTGHRHTPARAHEAQIPGHHSAPCTPH